MLTFRSVAALMVSQHPPLRPQLITRTGATAAVAETAIFGVVIPQASSGEQIQILNPEDK